MPYSPEKILLEKYRIEELIGRGAFGEVYRAQHLALNAPRALKILRKDAPGLGSSEYSDFYARFKLEAQLGARLGDHPHIIQVHDFEQEGEVLLLVMEYASGGSLTERLTQARQRDRLIPVDEAVQIAIDIAQGLSAIHALDAVHRDLKPSNILFDKKDRAKVADVGLAQIPGGPSMRSQLSTAAPHPGTPGYMSPEQERISNYLSPASDIYALGLVLFEMLTGRVYHAQRPGTRAGDLRPDVPAWLDDLLARMLAKEPEGRPWDGAEAAALLGQAVEKRKAEKEQQQAEERARQAADDRPQTADDRPPAVDRPRPVTRPHPTSGSGARGRPLWQRWPRWAWFAAAAAAAAAVVTLGIVIFGQLRPDPVTLAEATTQPVAVAQQPTQTSSLEPTSEPANTPTHTPTSTSPLAGGTEGGQIEISPVDGMVQVYIPEGEFLMGSNKYADEKPIHTVYLDAYWMDQTEVTNAQFAEFLNAQGNQEEGDVTWLDAGDEDVRIVQSGGEWQPQSGYGDHPAVEVSWYGARAYCEWAGRRLPTEAEWEKAARGGLEEKRYPWGDEDPVCEYGAENGAKFDDDAGCDDTRTEPVKSYSDNGYGLYDMAGNVWEWVSSLYQSYPYDAMDGREDLGASGGRVLRGGSWDDIGRALRVAGRSYGGPSSSYYYLGFRCARSP